MGLTVTTTLLSPTAGTVAVNEPVLLSWAAPDPLQVAFQVQMRQPGGVAWDVLDTGLLSGPDSSRLLAANTLPSADFEWRVGTALATLFPSATVYPDATLFPSYPAPDVQWSAAAFFAGRLRPAPPTIVAPAAGETVQQSRYDVEWTPAALPGVSAAQTRYRVRRTTVGGQVREDSGEVMDAAARKHTLRFQVSDVQRVVQVQTFYDGLWSDWASRQVYVFFVGPPLPEFVTSADFYIYVSITNPAPGAQQPALTRNEVHRRVLGDTGDGIPRALNLPADAVFTDHYVANRERYQYRVVAIGTDGNPTSTDWQE